MSSKTGPKKRRRHPLRFFASRKGVILMGVLSALFFLAGAYFFISGYLFINEPALFCTETHKAIRNDTLQNGSDISADTDESSARSYTLRAKSFTYEQEEYAFCVLELSRNAEYIGLQQQCKIDEDVFLTVFEFRSFLSDNQCPIDQAPFIIETYLCEEVPDGNGYVATTPYRKGYYLNTGLNVVRSVKVTTPAEDIDAEAKKQRVNEVAEPLLEQMRQRVPGLLQAVGFNDVNEELRSISKCVDMHEAGAIFALFTIVVAILWAPAFAVWLHCGFNLYLSDKRFRLVSAGVIQGNAQITVQEYTGALPEGTMSLPQEAAIEKEEDLFEEPDPTPGEEKELSPRVSNIGLWLERHHIRPFLGEWAIRIIGLVIFAIGGILAQFIAGKQNLEYLRPWFSSITETGRFVLIIAVVSIIAETRKNPRLTVIAFLTLGIFYYLVATAFCIFLDGIIPVPTSVSLSNLLATVSPGNLFFSIGIFAFLGFFLFSEPPHWLINRKVFRALSALPAALAILSIIFTILFRTNQLAPTYWVQNFLFVRNFEALFVGVLYEFALFFFRSRMVRKYGVTKAEEYMDLPVIQFAKNLVLGGLILFYTILYLLMDKQLLAILEASPITFVYLLIPVFLFYKPAGKNHKTFSDILYYILFLAAMGLPHLIQIILGLFAGA